MFVFAAGMARSGSTIQYQILDALVQWGMLGHGVGWFAPEDLDDVLHGYDQSIVTMYRVVKSHVVTPAVRKYHSQGKVVPFFIYRDPRDVAVSLMRVWNVSFHEMFRRQLLHNAVAAGNNWESLGCHSYRYEDYYRNWDQLVLDMAGVLNVSIDETDAKKMAAKFNLYAQRHVMRMIPDEQVYDPQTLLHPNHIGLGEGVPGQYKVGLDAFQIHIIYSEFGEWMAKHGYT
jgi:hypothetical protein